MEETEPQFLDVGEGPLRRRIAFRAERGRAPYGQGAPGLLWLPGMRSDMTGTKAEALAAYARSRGLAFTRFDYSGHGLSDGRFEDGTIGRWLEEAAAVFLRLTRGPQIIAGSSMGGYIALLLARWLVENAPREAARAAALVLIAPAWDMTEALIWGPMSEEDRRRIISEGIIHYPSPHGDVPITRALIEEGRNHLLEGRRLALPCPVSILQGLRDTEVPPARTRKLLKIFEAPVDIVEVADGDHSLSRPEDLARLTDIIGKLAGGD